MRGGGLAMVAFLLLAGCTQPLEEPAPPAPAGPGLVAEDVPFVGESYAGMDTCAAGTCSYSGDPPIYRPVAANQTITGFHLNLAGDIEAEVAWRILCDRRECPGLPIEITGALPLRIDVDGLSLQGPLTLRAEFDRTDGTSILVDQFVMLTMEGTIATLRDPTPAATVTVRQVHGGLDHVTGFCVFEVDPACGSTSNTVHLPIPGPLTRLRMNLTWDALSPTAETLGLQIRCLRNFGDACAEGMGVVRVDGPSPLMLDIEPGWVPVGDVPHEIMVEFFEGDLVYGGTRQPFRLDWTMDVRVETPTA